MSADDVATMKKFKEALAAPMHFVADQDKVLIKAYGITMPLTGWAKRTTWVIGPGRKVMSMQEGSEAIEPEGAIKACALHHSAVEEAMKPIAKPAWSADAGR